MKIKSISDLKALITKGKVTEHSHVNVELKRCWSQEHGKKISMLANAMPEETTYLVIGVEDNGNLSGHVDKWLKKDLEVFSQHLNSYLDPSITVEDLSTDDINGSKVIIAVIKNPGVVVKWNHKAYGGKGTTKTELKPEQILELNLKLPGLYDITKRKVDFIPDNNLVRKFCKIGGLKFDRDVLDRYHLKNTKCADLLFTSGTYRLIKYDISDNIIHNESGYGLTNVISDDMYKEIRKYYQDILEDSQRLSNRIFREALGNCVGHAAYHDNNGEITIELHSNRLVISNLAYQEYISLANKWFSHAHKSPNPFLMEVLRIIGIVDELGTGKKRLFSECLTQGFNTPYITITDAGRNKRWCLTIPISEIDERYKKLKERLNSLYKGNSEKCLISFALVLWSDKKFSEIAKYFDIFESKIAAEIISDQNGPVWYWEEQDSITLQRWVKVLIEEGKASKGFSEHEERRLFEHCRELKNKYSDGLITTKEFRELAHMSASSSDKVLASNILAKWKKEGKLKRIKKGTYKFTTKKTHQVEKSSFQSLIKAFEVLLNEK